MSNRSGDSCCCGVTGMGVGVVCVSRSFVLQRIAMCCSVLQCVAVIYIVLQCVGVVCRDLLCCSVLRCVAGRVLQCVALCCSMSVLCVCRDLLCCSVLQCVAPVSNRRGDSC